MTKCFEIQETCSSNQYVFHISCDFFNEYPNLICKNSYLVFAARLLGLSYVDFLKYCSDCGGTIIGKNTFPHPVFDNKRDGEKICEILNTTWGEIEKELS